MIEYINSIIQILNPRDKVKTKKIEVKEMNNINSNLRKCLQSFLLSIDHFV